MNISIVVNPISGKGKGLDTANKIKKAVSSENLSCIIAPTSAKGDAPKLCNEYANSDLIIIISGDGTLSECLPALIKNKTPFLLVPFGTGNVFAKAFNLTKNTKNIVNLIQKKCIVDVDVGVINNEVYFHSMVGVGFDASVVSKFHMKRTGPTPSILNYAPIAISTYKNYEMPQISVSIDNKMVCPNASFVQVANVHTYGGHFKFVNDAKTNDGLLDVFVLETANKKDILKMWLNAMMCKAHKTQCSKIFKGEHITITSNDEVPVQVDGDPYGKLPIEINVIKNAVKVVAPNEI